MRSKAIMKIQQTKPKTFCFVLMPFAPEFDDIYAFGIKGACEDANTYCERVDEQIFQGSVLERIYNQISKADIVIADMSGRSPNVFYEVGYAHALGKPTILLTKQAEDIPFDLKHFPHIVYNSKIQDLRKELARRVEWFAAQPRTASEYNLGIDVYFGKIALSSGEAVCRFSHNDGNTYSVFDSLVFHNTSSNTYHPGGFRVGIIVSGIYFNMTKGIVFTEMPDSSRLLMFSEFETLFPGSYYSVNFRLGCRPSNIIDGDEIKIRIFSEAGYRDFPLKVIFVPKKADG
jgi:hypothetical protein